MIRLCCVVPIFALFLSISLPAAAQDEALTAAARTALRRAEGLTNRAIELRVLGDGTAILSGPARPADAARAEQVLKGVPGITQVLNTCEPVVEAHSTGPALPPPPPATVGAPVGRSSPAR